MRNRHWSDEDQLEYLYGLRSQDQHLKECPICALRSKQLKLQRRKLMNNLPDVSETFLAKQREQIRLRLTGKKPILGWRSVPALAMALLLLAVILWFRPATKPTAVIEISDAELFQKAYSEVYTPQPRAVEPLKSLFEKNQ